MQMQIAGQLISKWRKSYLNSIVRYVQGGGGNHWGSNEKYEMGASCIPALGEKWKPFETKRKENF